mmetsp:Transcript_20870/g.30900  ORF Transcript_20870/g.30900 Transcript_20870/m.30900 type:complete len:1078 (-) Transcript_20870:3728-6961(-)
MGKGKKGKKGRRDDWSDEEEGKTPEVTKDKEEGEGDKQLSRKQKRLQKQQQKQQGQKKESEDEDEIMALIKSGGGDDYGSDDNSTAPAKRGKNQRKAKKGRQPSVSSDEGEDEDTEEDAPQPIQKGKRGKKKGSQKVNISDDDSSDEEIPQPVKKGKRGKNKQKGKQATVDSDEEDGSSYEEEVPQPVQKGKRGKNKGIQKANAFASAIDTDDEEEEIEEVTNEEEVEQIAFTMIDDDDEKGKEKKKKKKKEKDKKKEKKKKKDKKKDKKKEKKDGSSGDEDGNKGDDTVEVVEDDDIDSSLNLGAIVDKTADLSLQSTPESQKPKVAPQKPDRPKTKLELQMEEAMRKKKDHEASEKEKLRKDAERIADEEKRAAAEEERAEREADEIRRKMEEEEAKNNEGVEEFYGHGDEAWTDKSAAQREAEQNDTDEQDTSLTHGPDGKKLSNKERKRLLKQREAAARMAEYEKVATKASNEGAQFACSQTAVNEKDPQWENALEINVPNFSISAAGKVLFKDASLMIAKGRRYGLVGPNGKGKSTLLKMIASGDLKIPPRIDFLYVEQEVVADDTPAVEAVLRADTKRWALMEEEEALMKGIDAGDETVTNLDRLQVVTEELANMGADSAEAKARRILFGLGFDMDMQVKPTKMFSGGWRMRISLARALFIEPTLLMLDEPTNHLDLNAVIWLDDYLQRWKKTLLVVSHDQDFLNSVTQEILHIEDLKLVSYKGNYDSFKKAEATRFQQQVKAWEKQEKRLRELKRKGQSKSKAQEMVKKSNKREPGARSKKATNDAVSSGQEAAEAIELIKRPKEYAVRFEFTDVADIGRPIMQVNRVHFRYSARHPVIFDEVDFGIDMDSRICVVGPNGAGKSTLIKLMTGELDATKGETKRNPRLRMGVYNQHFVDRLPMNKTPVEFLRDSFEGETYQSVRNRLGKYGLEGHAHEVVMRDLSGGQKARVVFVELSLQQPHVLLLDEPTNNLDIESIDALIDAINNFNGGIVVVTHDQRLIENCDCNLWVVEKKKVTPWEEGFDNYKETLLREMEEEIERQTEKRRKKMEEAAKAKAEKLERLKSKLKS